MSSTARRRHGTARTTRDEEASGRRRALTEFLATEAGGAVILLAATAVALVWANSPWSATYHDFWHTSVRVGGDGWGIDESLQHWVNDAAMAIFFFLIGLELKRELVAGELRDRRKAALPALCALGGMVVPAVLYLAIAGGGESGRGWGIPMATDITFALGVLALVGPRIPRGARAFLLALAIIDDIGAIAVIAVFYSNGVALGGLAAAFAVLAAVFLVRRSGAGHPGVYIPLAVAAWYCAFQAGVHPTLAGVALGLLTPARPVGGRDVLGDLEHRLHPWSSYLVIPIFALANAGVSLAGGALQRAFTSPVTWAVIVGFVVGKTVGIAGTALLGIRARLGLTPAGVETRHLVGVGALGGIGFTVALFIVSLAFPSELLQAEAKVGILGGSLLSGALGALVLVARPGRRPAH